MQHRIRETTLVVGALLFGTIGINQIASANDNTTVKIGIVGDSARVLWRDISKRVKSKYGITIKLTEFNDYVKPNQALVDGSIDLNAFQTKIFFDDQNKKLGSKLKSIGKTIIIPMKLYSLKHTKVSQIKKGSTIAVPNDATNEERALNVLVQAKLIKYDTSVANPTSKNITYNPKQLKIKEVDAAQTVTALKSADGAVINGNYAQDAELSEKKVLVAQNLKKNVAPYINIIAARKDKADNDVYKKIVKEYQTKATKKELKKLYGESELPAWNLN